MKLILTCEHGGNQVPFEYLTYFNEAGRALDSHRGYDPGALDLFRYLLPLADQTYYSETSRLFVELNRSLHHPKLFSEYSNKFTTSQKKTILEQYYQPYRNTVEAGIAESLEGGREVLHISVHSFTPVLEGEVRKTDIGLLFDPSRREEKEFSKKFKSSLKAIDPTLLTRFNYPYLGIADGLPTYLRRLFPKAYHGIELEVNQKFVNKENQMQLNVKRSILLVLRQIMQEW